MEFGKAQLLSFNMCFSISARVGLAVLNLTGREPVFVCNQVLVVFLFRMLRKSLDEKRKYTENNIL